MTSRLHRVDSAADGLAREAEAFASADARVFLWTSTRLGLVCPESFRRKPGFDVAVRASRARGWPVHLRPTGGGAVPQGPGIVNLALTFTASGDFTIEDGYRLITRVIRAAVPANLSAGATPSSFCDGAWNLSLSGRKVVGTAQRLRPVGAGRRRVLAHALILMEGDIRPLCRAVSAFHADLGLPPVSTHAHATLADASGAVRPDAATLSAALHAAAVRALSRVGACVLDKAASCIRGNEGGIAPAGLLQGHELEQF